MRDEKALHSKKVESIAAALRERAERNSPAHINKGGVPHFVPLPNDERRAGKPLDVSVLNRIIEIDPGARVCVAEPGVTFGELVEATLAHGLVPKVVPELEDITIGGAVAGCSIESMSYKYGGFHDSCLEYEVVTGAGEVLVCSPEKDAEIFEMMHGSYGTLGLLTRIEFELVPAGPFVRLDYHIHRTIESFDEAMKAACEKGDYELIDGIIHGPDKLVLCLGNFVNEAPYTSKYDWLNIYYKSTAKRSEDYLHSIDYFFRYDAECHWMTKTVPPLEWKPVRLAVGKVFLGSSNLIKWSRRLDKVLALKKRPDVVCDVFIPANRFPEFFNWYVEDFDFFPLWIVPYKPPKKYPWLSEELASRQGDQLFIDCAVYGRPNSGTIDYSKLLEEKVFELDGIKTLISRNHYSRDRFWQIYNRTNYEAAKQRMDPAGVFPDLYESLGRVE